MMKGRRGKKIVDMTYYELVLLILKPNNVHWLKLECTKLFVWGWG